MPQFIEARYDPGPHFFREEKKTGNNASKTAPTTTMIAAIAIPVDWLTVSLYASMVMLAGTPVTPQKRAQDMLQDLPGGLDETSVLQRPLDDSDKGNPVVGPLNSLSDRVTDCGKPVGAIESERNGDLFPCGLDGPGVVTASRGVLGFT